MSVQLYLGDCRDVMASMEPDTFDSIVTDPPYGLAFMGKDWDHGVPGVAFWQAALRVAKPGAHLLAFGGTRTFHRLAVAIEDAGWEIRDTVMWVYGSGFPKSHNLDGDWQGWSTALKPAWEPIIVARKPFGGTVAANVLEWGTGAINVDGCRVGTEVETWPTSRRNGSGDGRTCERGSGDAYTASTGKAPNGRWPANLVHDGSEEVLRLFPNAGGGFGKRGQRTVGEGWATRKGDANSWRGTDETVGYGDTGSAARFFYVAKASKADRDEGCEGLEERDASIGDRRPSGSMSQRIHADTGRPDTISRNHHPTVKPTDLMRYLCRLVTQPGGVVLDPFVGSGSTGKAARLEGFAFVGIDREAEYLEIARRRIAAVELPLLVEVPL